MDACTALKTRWLDWNPSTQPSPFLATDLDFSMKSNQIKEFLDQLLAEEREFDLVKAKAMQEVYDFNSMKNCEIRFT